MIQIHTFAFAGAKYAKCARHVAGMLAVVPEGYDETYKYYTRRGSRVLALGFRETESMSAEKVRGACC